jgi:ubiquinol-cytochrome c reductase cytochrome b subunit
VRSATFRPLTRVLFWLFVANSIVLGYCGAKPPEGWYLIVGRLATAWYFLHYILLFVITKYGIEKPLPLPQSIGQPVLATTAGGR